MADLPVVAPAFVAMAHSIVWATVATVDPEGRPRSRILHPYWEWDGETLVGWVATAPTPVKMADLAQTPHASVNYWSPRHDTCTAECDATWAFDDETRGRVWELFRRAPAPLGYDPAAVERWKDGPTSPAFAVLRLAPYRLRVFPGTVTQTGRDVLRWRR